MDAFWQYWNDLTVRQAIIVGIITTVFGSMAYAIVAGGWKMFGKLALAIARLIQRILNWALPSAQSANLVPKEIKSDPPATREQIPQDATDPIALLVPLIPKSPLVGFVARRDKAGHEIVQVLKEKLAPESNQLVTLWGEGGVGKTTLAAEAARALIEAYRQRIVWASADKRADFTFSTLLDEIAVQLNHADLLRLAIGPKKVEAQALIASAPTLIVLDNFETIAPAEQNLCVAFLAERSPYPSLITTRQKIDGVQNVAIDAMSLAEARDFLKRLVEQAGDSLSISAPEHDRIIDTAGRNPLVMQWVVAQIELAQRPSDVLDELARGGGDAAQRVFDRSFDLEYLGDDGRAALLALSPFVPDASRPALAQVAGFGSDVERLNKAVKRLAALRLVAAAAGGERLTIQGLTRELAKARLSKDEHVNDYRRRFVAHFMSYANVHAQPTPEDFDALEAEKDNLLGAIDVAFDLEDWHSVMDIRGALEEFLDLRGYWDEAIRRGEQAVAASHEAENESSIAQFIGNVAVIRMQRGEYEEARQTYQQALVTFKKSGGEVNVAACLHQLGRLAHDQGEIEEARRLYNESLEINKRLDNQSRISGNLHQLAMIAHDQGEIEEARRLYNESLEIAKRLSDQNGIASTLHQLAILAQDQGEIEKARRLYNESLEIRKRLGNQSGIAGTLGQLGSLAYMEGNKAEAVRLTREALGIFEELKSPNAEKARRILKRLEGESS
ncbi:MAG: tetratricopeptide repeat protein [Pyrinomonadaceae bacterium]